MPAKTKTPNHTQRPLPDGMTLAAARALRVSTEQQVLTVLRQLAEATGLDVRNVEVVRHAVPMNGTGDPQVIPVAVRIDLTV